MIEPRPEDEVADGLSIRTLALEERSRAAERVRVELNAIRDLLAAACGPVRVVAGSAMSAEVEFDDEPLRRRFTRIRIAVAGTALDAARIALVTAGFTASARQDDLPLIRLAQRRGRRIQFTLFDDALPPGASPDESSPPYHPGSPEAVRERTLRLTQWRIAPIATLVREQHHRSEEDGDVSATVEVELVADSESEDRPPRVR